MRQLAAIVLMQLKDKIDLSFVKDGKQFLIKTVLAVLKFALITAICYFVIMLSRVLLGIFNSSEIPAAMTFVVGVFFLLSTVSCTVSLIKTMYYSDDNKVLVTFPVDGNVVFISKLLVFYFYELKRNLSLLAPILLGFGLNLVSVKALHWGFFPFMWLTLIAYTALPALLGALLSIPGLYVYRFFSRFRWVGYLAFAIVLAAFLFGTVSLISAIPENLDLPRLWPAVRGAIQAFLAGFEYYFPPFVFIVRSFIGERSASYTYSITLFTLLRLLILVATVALLAIAVYFSTRKLFYVMMRKSFEFKKDLSNKKIKNKVYGKKTTFFVKELRLALRSRTSVITELAVGIITPILVFLMNKIFSAINTSITGNNMAYAFNLLVILLPLLASNSSIASAYSREGRAATIKKTKPTDIVLPILAKPALNAFCSTLSLVTSAIVFASFNGFGTLNVFFLALSLVSLNLGHILLSARFDLMRPKNEAYATTGELQNNPNEALSTALAFIISGLFALASFKLFDEAVIETGSLRIAFVKLFLIGLVFFALSLYMFVIKIRAFYYERQA